MELKLRELRKNRKLTQEEVGKILKMSQSTYQTYENNRAIPSIENLITLSDYYDVTLDYLCGHTPKHRQELGYLDEKTLAILKLTQELTDKNKDQAFYYISGLVAGQ